MSYGCEADIAPFVIRGVVEVDSDLASLQAFAKDFKDCLQAFAKDFKDCLELRPTIDRDEILQQWL